MQSQRGLIPALLGATFGWIWILSIPVSIWTFGTAIFSGEPWSRFFWSISIGFVAKNMLRGFDANRKRIAFEAQLVARGVLQEHARELAFIRMNGGQADFAQKLRDLGYDK